MVKYNKVRRPGYAKSGGLVFQAFCRACGKTRYVEKLSELQPCDGGGPYTEVRCGSCGKEFQDYKLGGCMHRVGDPSCLVWQRKT